MPLMNSSADRAASAAGAGRAFSSEPAVARNKNGNLEVFVRGTDNGLAHVADHLQRPRLVELKGAMRSLDLGLPTERPRWWQPTEQRWAICVPPVGKAAQL